MHEAGPHDLLASVGLATPMNTKYIKRAAVSLLMLKCKGPEQERGAFLVPTLVTYQKLVSEGAAAGLAQDLVDKVGTLLADGIKAVTLAHMQGKLLTHLQWSPAAHMRCMLMPGTRSVEQGTRPRQIACRLRLSPQHRLKRCERQGYLLPSDLTCWGT